MLRLLRACDLPSQRATEQGAIFPAVLPRHGPDALETRSMPPFLPHSPPGAAILGLTTTFRVVPGVSRSARGPAPGETRCAPAMRESDCGRVAGRIVDRREAMLPARRLRRRRHCAGHRALLEKASGPPSASNASNSRCLTASAASRVHSSFAVRPGWIRTSSCITSSYTSAERSSSGASAKRLTARTFTRRRAAELGSRIGKS